MFREDSLVSSLGTDVHAIFAQCPQSQCCNGIMLVVHVRVPVPIVCPHIVTPRCVKCRW
jgi:hypothetical protein